MTYDKDLVWAIHDSMKSPTRMTRGMLNKKRRLGWREYKGDYDGKEENKTQDYKEESCEENKKENSNEYNRLIKSGVIREFS